MTTDDSLHAAAESLIDDLSRDALWQLCDAHTEEERSRAAVAGLDTQTFLAALQREALLAVVKEKIRVVMVEQQLADPAAAKRHLYGNANPLVALGAPVFLKFSHEA